MSRLGPMLLFVFVLLASGLSQAAEFTRDSLKKVAKNVAESKAVLVDVRSKDEWEKGHIEGSLFLPITRIEEERDSDELRKMLPKKKILYTFCVIGMRAEAAGEILSEMGYEVRVLKPGYKELIEAGFKKAKQEDEDS